MNIAAIEADIITRLAPLRTAGLLVRALPNESSEFGKVVGAGVITVSWSVDDAQPPVGMGAFHQDINMQWVLDIRVKNLRNGSAAAIALRSSIYSLLVGFKPAGCRKMYAQRFEFADRQDSYWQYIATFIAPTTIVENVPDEIDPLLELLTYEGIVNGESEFEFTVPEAIAPPPGLQLITLELNGEIMTLNGQPLELTVNG